jgi:16S rRNA (guanine527-N7)-methyltransferase
VRQPRAAGFALRARLAPAWRQPAVQQLQPDIERGCREVGLEASATMLASLADFVLLLEKWNRVYNLTAVREPRAMVARHILDSLVVLPWIGSGRLLDVGTGAGLPGIPLAIARPDLAVTLLDANAKKLRFVRQAVAELQLDNVELVHTRMQQYRPAQAFDMVISRAVADLRELYTATAHLVRPGGRQLFMKGGYPQSELTGFVPPGPLHVERLQVPSLQAERHLVWIDTEQESDSRRQ